MVGFKIETNTFNNIRKEQIMSSELEALFDGITSNDQEVIDSVTQRIEDQMENPQFIFFLFQNLTDQLLKSNPSIYMLVQITIINNIRKKWESKFTEDTPIYWSPEIQENILYALLDLAFSVPSSQRDNFIEPIIIIIQKCFPFVSFITQRLEEIYAKDKTNIVNTKTYIDIAINISQILGDRLFHAERKDRLEEVIEINNQILENVFNIIPACIPSISEEEVARIITKDAIKVICCSTFHINELLAKPIFTQILQQIFELLLIESNEESIQEIKVQVFKLISFLNSNFLCKRMKFKTEVRIQFAGFYRKEVVPPIIESTIKVLQEPMNYELRKCVMDVFHQFLKFRAYAENIFTPDFVTNVLLQNSRIDEEDADDPEINPTFYANINMDMDLLGDDGETPRTFSAMIVKQAIKKLDLQEPLYQFFFSESDNAFDFEAKIFLLIKYLKTLIHLEKKRRKKLKKKNLQKLGPIQPQIAEDDFRAILEKLQGSNPPFVQISLIMVCTLFFKYNDPKQGIQIANQIILDGDLPIIAYYGAKMFNSCLKQFERNYKNEDNYESEYQELFKDFEPLKTIDKLFAVTKIFNDDTAATTIKTLCTSDINVINQSGPELFRILFELVYDHCVNSETDKNAQGEKEILDSIFNTIVVFDNDSPIVLQIMNIAFEFTSKALDEIADIFECYEELYEILALLNQKITHTQPSQVEMLKYLLPLWVKLPDISLHSSRQICQFTYPLITSEENPFNEDQEAKSNIIQFAQFMILQSAEEIKNEQRRCKTDDPSHSMGYSLFLASCILLVWGDVNDAFLENAISVITPFRIQKMKIRENYFLTLMGAFFVLAAYFIIDSQKVVSALNPEMIEAITSIIKPKFFPEYREMVVGMILLLNFAKLGCNQAYLTAAKCFKYLIKFKKENDNNNNNNNEDDEDDDDDESSEYEEEEEEEEEADGVFLFQTDYQTPFEKYDAIQLFKDVSDQTGLFASLDEELQTTIQNLVK